MSIADDIKHREELVQMHREGKKIQCRRPGSSIWEPIMYEDEIRSPEMEVRTACPQSRNKRKDVTFNRQEL